MRVVINEEIDATLKGRCEEMSKRYGIEFLEIGTEGDPEHFLEQSVPTYSPRKIVRTIKSIRAKEICKRQPEVKENSGVMGIM